MPVYNVLKPVCAHVFGDNPRHALSRFTWYVNKVPGLSVYMGDNTPSAEVFIVEEAGDDEIINGTEPEAVWIVKQPPDTPRPITIDRSKVVEWFSSVDPDIGRGTGGSATVAEELNIKHFGTKFSDFAGDLQVLVDEANRAGLFGPCHIALWLLHNPPASSSGFSALITVTLPTMEYPLRLCGLCQELEDLAGRGERVTGTAAALAALEAVAEDANDTLATLRGWVCGGDPLVPPSRLGGAL